MNRTRSFFPRALLLLVVAGSLLGTTLLAAPLSPTPDPPSLIKHLRAEIGSRDAMRLENALMDVVMLSLCESSCTVQFVSIPDKRLRIENESGTGTAVDLDALVPDLLTAYHYGPSDGHRLLALSALINIGNATALEQLVDESSDRSSPQSRRVNRATQRSLAAFYLEKYPELTERAMRNMTFSLEDVRRAETIQVKLARKDARAAVQG